MVGSREISISHPRTFLFVFKNEKQSLEFVLYYDDMPTPKMLSQLRKTVVYRRELFGRFALWSLSEIENEFHKRVSEGNLPPENIVIAKKQSQPKGE